MKVRYFAFGFIAALALQLIIPVLAQSSISEIPACTRTQTIEVVNYFDDEGYLAGFQDIYARSGDIDMNNLEGLIDDVNDLQVDWWEDAVPELPNCTFAKNLAIEFGHFLDEVLISLTLGQAIVSVEQNGDEAYSQRLLGMLQPHVDQFTLATGNLATLIEEATESIK